MVFPKQIKIKLNQLYLLKRIVIELFQKIVGVIEFVLQPAFLYEYDATTIEQFYASFHNMHNGVKALSKSHLRFLYQRYP